MYDPCGSCCPYTTAGYGYGHTTVIDASPGIGFVGAPVIGGGVTEVYDAGYAGGAYDTGYVGGGSTYNTGYL